jgi:hypothetical protein
MYVYLFIVSQGSLVEAAMYLETRQPLGSDEHWNSLLNNHSLHVAIVAQHTNFWKVQCICFETCRRGVWSHRKGYQVHTIRRFSSDYTWCPISTRAQHELGHAQPYKHSSREDVYFKGHEDDTVWSVRSG